jgi:hypothetical protein
MVSSCPNEYLWPVHYLTLNKLSDLYWNSYELYAPEAYDVPLNFKFLITSTTKMRALIYSGGINTSVV